MGGVSGHAAGRVGSHGGGHCQDQDQSVGHFIAVGLALGAGVAGWDGNGARDWAWQVCRSPEAGCADACTLDAGARGCAIAEFELFGAGDFTARHIRSSIRQ